MVVAEAAWGRGPQDLGRRGGAESSPEGPMSFDVDERGRAVVLDQVNRRLQRFEAGAAVGSVPLPADTYQDMALGAQGRVALLDRFGTSSVTIVDETGSVSSQVPLVGSGVPDGGSVTGLFQREDGTWVEVGHAELVRVATADGHPDVSRPMASGRFSADGSGLLRAARSGSHGAVVTRTPARGAPELFATVPFELPVHHLTALDSEPSGRVLLGASLVEEEPVAPYDVLDEAEAIVLLDGRGNELRRWLLPATAGPEETFRAVRFGRDGAVYCMQLTPFGVVIRRYAA